MADIKVPSVGESIHEGVLARWLKEEGDSVDMDEPLFELETDKATTEVPAPAAGVLHIGAKEGATVSVGEVVGRIEPGKGKKKDSGQPADDGKNDKQAPEKKAAPAPSEEKKEKQPAGKEELAASPSARRLVREHALDPGAIEGTGRGGRITEQDVRHFLDDHATRGKEKQQEAPKQEPGPARPAEATAPASTGERRQRMSAIRQRIADRLLASQRDTATLTTFNEVDMSAVLELRQRYREEFKKKHGVDLGFMSFFVKAAVTALRDFPVVNAFIDGPDVVFHDEYHVGVAVSTERGLMVPVLREADRLSFADIEKRIAALAEKARTGKITIDDLQGGTFTITNGGVFGSLLSTPILNPPQSGILGMHTIQKRPVARDDQVVIRPMMYLALSYDHRLVDGRDAVKFLVRIKESIEDPERMLFQV